MPVLSYVYQLFNTEQCQAYPTWTLMPGVSEACQGAKSSHSTAFYFFGGWAKIAALVLPLLLCPSRCPAPDVDTPCGLPRACGGDAPLGEAPGRDPRQRAHGCTLQARGPPYGAHPHRGPPHRPWERRPPPAQERGARPCSGATRDDGRLLGDDGAGHTGAPRASAGARAHKGVGHSVCASGGRRSARPPRLGVPTDGACGGFFSCTCGAQRYKRTL